MTHTVETITVFAVEATIQSGTFRRTSTEFSECGLKSVKFKASSVFLSPEPNMGHIVLYFCSVYDRRSPGWHAKRPILFPVFMPPPPLLCPALLGQAVLFSSRLNFLATPPCAVAGNFVRALRHRQHLRLLSDTS